MEFKIIKTRTKHNSGYNYIKVINIETKKVYTWDAIKFFDTVMIDYKKWELRVFWVDNISNILGTIRICWE
jgi:hypothetical protein